MNSIASLLNEAAAKLTNASDSARLDAEVLLCKTLKKSRSYLRAWPDRELSPEQHDAFWTLVESRREGIPVAYLTGQKEFWSRDFLVTPDVLIPRPETELLIELGLELIPKEQPCRIIDLGTGSGIIAITLATERPLADVIASDFNLAALDIARKNAEMHRVKNIRFYHSNWFTEIPKIFFDLIVSNPPYIAEGDTHLAQGDLRFEPLSSLCSAAQGLADITCIADHARNRLHPGGHLLIEHGYNQRQPVQTLFKQFGYDKVRTELDLSGQPRVSYGQYNPKPE